jgi:hypothetical protein
MYHMYVEEAALLLYVVQRCPDTAAHHQAWTQYSMPSAQCRVRPSFYVCVRDAKGATNGTRWKRSLVADAVS